MSALKISAAASVAAQSTKKQHLKTCLIRGQNVVAILFTINVIMYELLRNYSIYT